MNLLPVFYMIPKALSRHIHGIHANMDQLFQSIFAGQPNSVQRIRRLDYGSVEGCVDRLSSGMYPATGAKYFLTEHGIWKF